MTEEELQYPEYYEHFSKLIDIQQKVSEFEFRKSIGKTIKELMKEGRCVHRVHITRKERVYERKESEDKDAIEEKFHITLEYHTGRKFPENSFAVGSNVYLLADPSDNLHFKENITPLTGLIVGLTNFSIIIEILSSAHSLSFLHDDITIILGSDHVTYPRQKKMLKYFCSTSYIGNGCIREIIINTFHKRKSTLKKDILKLDNFFFKKIDESKKEAVRSIMGNNDILLLHGPPGTGKTLTCAESICQTIYSNSNNKILVCCDSNEAVDNILLKVSDILKKPADNIILRVGHPFKVQERTKEYTLIKKFNNHPLIKHFLKHILYEESTYWNKEYKEKQKEYRKSCTTFGTNSENSEDLFKAYKNAQNNYFKIQKQIHGLRKIVIEEIYKNSRIYFCTNSVAAIPEIQSQVYDLVVIDEATQTTEPSCIIPICRANKLLLAGDHKQLPATVLIPKEEAEAELVKELETSLFEKIIILNPEIPCLLAIQYRMNDTLLFFPNKKFYDGHLRSAEENKDDHLNLFFDKDIVFINNYSPEKPDYTGKDFYEERTTSKYNPGEIELVEILISAYRKIGLTDMNITVITPYNLQKQKLKDILSKYQISAKSIDGAQGQENDIILLSLVRSNQKGVVGFLKDERRFNVAITRAKSKLIIIGNSKTLVNNPLLNEWIEYIKKEGLFIEKEELEKYFTTTNEEQLQKIVKDLKSIKPSESYNLDIINNFIKNNEEWFASLNYSQFSKYIDLIFISGWNVNLPQKDRLDKLKSKINPETVMRILEAFHWISFRKYYLRGIEDPYFISICEQDRVKIEEYSLKNNLITEEDLITVKKRITIAKQHIENQIKRKILLERQSPDSIVLEENVILKDLFE